MNRLENNLRRVFRQPEPPDDLAAKVIYRARHAASRRVRSYQLRVAATLIVIAGLLVGVLEYRHRRDTRIENERAGAQLAEAFRLAGEQLRPFHQQMEQMQRMTIAIPAGEK